MRSEILYTLLLFPAFLAVETTRAVQWATRTVDEPDRDGPLLRALVALLVSVLSVVPGPVWTAVAYMGWLAWIPVRSVLWLLGIGREDIWKRSPKAVNEWYEQRRMQRTKMRRGRRKDSKEKDEEDSE